MNADQRRIEKILVQHLPSPSEEETSSARDRAWHRVQLRAHEAKQERFVSADQASSYFWQRIVMSAAAALVVFAIIFAMQFHKTMIDAHAVVETGDGNLLEAGSRIDAGKAIRTSDQGALLTLNDGSRIEMRSKTELVLEAADDGVRIRLSSGGILVNANPQRKGHLYVHTKDVSVSVVGTVFLVNAEEEGSRVAVIQGEVRVQGQATVKNLRPGEQAVSSPSMESYPLSHEIAWSRNAEEHMALLQRSTGNPLADKTSTVAGVVRSGSGNLASGLRVAALRADSANEVPQIIESLAETNATGHFQLDIPPGRFYIMAGRVDQPTYYPGTLDIGKGVALSITAATSISGIDFAVEETSVAPLAPLLLPPLPPPPPPPGFRRSEAAAVKPLAPPPPPPPPSPGVQRTGAAPRSGAEPNVEFAAVSIKSFSPGTRVGATGFACRGIDGLWRASFGVGDLVVPLGRCVGAGNVFLGDVIGFAYGLGGQHVSGGPEWVRPAPPPARPGSAQSFQIEAVTTDPSTATLEKLSQMLQRMLADRFKLKVHHETQQAQGYALVIAKDGPRLKEVSGGVDSPRMITNSSEQLVISGKSNLDKLAQTLGEFVGAPIIDKTGLTGTYEYEVLRSEGGGTTAPRAGGPGLSSPLRTVSQKADDISKFLERQQGLRLQSERAVPVEIIVIDSVEKPSEN